MTTVTTWTVSSAIEGAVLDALDVADRKPKASVIAIGSVTQPMSECCGGALTIGTGRVFNAVAPFPTEVVDTSECGQMIAVEVTVRLDRCVPTITRGKQIAPDLDKLAAAYESVHDDGTILWNLFKSREWRLMVPGGLEVGPVSQRFIDEEGGCIGVETTFTVGVSSGVWCI